MPESGQPSPHTLTASQLAVLGRWNPSGAELLRDIGAGSGAPAVCFTGPASTELGAELCIRVPGLPVSSTLAGATVAVVTIPAAAPPGSDSLRVIQSAHDAGCHVLLAMTGIDHHRDWRHTRRAATEILLDAGIAAAAPQIWPVAPGLAARARQWPDTAEASLVDACSGLAELQDALTAALREPASPARIKQVQASAARVALRRIAATRDKLADTSADDALRANRSRLALRRDGGRAEASSTLRSALALARVDLLHDVGAGLRAINTTARDEVDQSSGKRLPGYPQRLQQHVNALAINTGAQATSRLRAAAVQARLTPPPPASFPAPATGEGPEPRRGTVEDQMILVTGASAGVGAGRLAVSPLSLTPALDYAVWPATLLLGGGAAWWLIRSRKQLAARAAMRQWITDALVNVKGQLEQQLIAAVLHAETALTTQITQQSAERTVAVDAQLAAVDAELRKRATLRQAQSQACDRDRAALSS